MGLLTGLFSVYVFGAFVVFWLSFRLPMFIKDDDYLRRHLGYSLALAALWPIMVADTLWQDYKKH